MPDMTHIPDMPVIPDINENPYIPIKCVVLDFYQETEDSFTITFAWHKGYVPGQFVMASLPGIGEAAISICSDSKEIMKLNIREVGSVTKSLGKLKKGDNIFIRGPYGKGYPMEDLQGKNIIMVGGGTGVAPLKGSLDYIANNKSLYNDVNLFFGFRSEEDILFERELEGWIKDFNTTVSFDDVRDKEKAKTYGDNKGFITEFLKEADMEKENTVAFVCGPHLMMDFTIKILKEKGFNDIQIFLSTERLMQCGIGKCGHCMIRGHYSCLEGPVFRYDEIGGYSSD